MPATSGHSDVQGDASGGRPGWKAGRGPEAEAVDSHMLAALRRRSQDALAAIVRRHGAMLSRAAWLYLGDAHEAEDAVQETFLAAWDSARRTADSTTLRPWLLGILANRCHKHIRSARRRRRREAAQARPDVQPPDAEPADARMRELQEAIGRLGRQHREVVVLRFWQGLSVQETAVALGIPPGTVKSRCHIAMEKLRQMMSESK